MRQGPAKEFFIHSPLVSVLAVLGLQALVQAPNALARRLISQRGEIVAEANLYVLLRQVVPVDQHLADLVDSIGVLAIVGVIVLEQKIAVAMLDDRLGVGLDLVHDAQDFGDLAVERSLGAEEDVAIGMGGVIAVIHQFRVGADLAVVARDQFEEAQDAALVHGAKNERRRRLEQVFLDVLAEADEAHRKVFGLRLLDLPDVERSSS